MHRTEHYGMGWLSWVPQHRELGNRMDRVMLPVDWRAVVGFENEMKKDVQLEVNFVF
jgi:hypothetical protein